MGTHAQCSLTQNIDIFESCTLSASKYDAHQLHFGQTVRRSMASSPVETATHAAIDASDDQRLPVATPREPDSDAAFKVQGFRLYAILVGICFGAFMMSLDVFIISTVRA